MLSRVIPFRKKADIVGWRPDELAECYRVVGLLARSGLPVSIDSGLTDEGEPWAIVLREDTGDVLLHMARLDGAFVVVSAAGPVAQRGESLRAVLDTAVRTGGLAILTHHSAAADCEILRLHPATLIAALIAAAWVHTQTSQAELLEASARREEGGANRTDEARVAGFAALPPSAALATAATSFAAVAAALHAPQTDPILEVTSEDFIQAALELVAEAPVIDTPVSAAPIELANLELRQDGPLISSATMDGPVPSEAPLAAAHIIVRLEAVVSPVPMLSAGDIPRFLVQQQSITQSLGLDWGAADVHFLAIGPLDTADFAPMQAARPLLMDTSSPSAEGPALAASPAGQMPAPAHPTVVAEPAPTRQEEDGSVVRTTLPVMMHEASLRSAYSWDAQGFFFKSAVQILHLDRVVIPTGTAASGSPDKNSDGVPAALGVTPVSASVPADAGGALPSTASSVVSLAPPAQGATLPQAVPSDSDVSGGRRPLTVEVQPAPPSNAQLLLEFTNRTEHVVLGGRDGLTGPLTGHLTSHLETGDARKVVIFDAPWLQAKSFMLMPGVMMMEDDLLGGVNRAGMDMKGSPVSLDLGGGLTLTLLGVVDLGLT